jgi:hypothetical protein
MVTKAECIEMGYNGWVAEALEGQELTVLDLDIMSEEEILDKVFEWHGFIGFTRSIIDAVDNVRNVEAL